MNLGKYIFGIREEYILQLEQGKREEQFLSYNILAAMFFVLVGLAFISSFCFGLILFQSWTISFILGIGFAAICFILLLLVLFLNMNTNDSELQRKMNDFEAYYQSIKEKRFETVTDEEALTIISEHEQLLRISNEEPQKSEFHISQLFIALVKIILVLVLSFIVANGIEMLMFQGKMNDALSIIKNSKEINSVLADTSSSLVNENMKTNAQWTLNMLTENPSEPFILINCYSFLLNFEILTLCLGKWKIVFDLFFAILFLIPFIMVKKSSRFAGGGYVKELMIAHISTTLLFRILADRKCAEIRKEIETFDYNSLLIKGIENE
jgi:hypothetical protein